MKNQITKILKSYVRIIFYSMSTLSIAYCMLWQTCRAQSVFPPSKWGVNDTLGSYNYLTSAKVLEATKLVTQGKTYALGIEVSNKTPAYGWRKFDLYMMQPNLGGGKTWGSNKFTVNDEMVVGWMGVGSQLNGLGHIGINYTLYNNNKVTDIIGVNGAKKLSLDILPPMVSRGIALDMTAYYKTDILKEGTIFNSKEIEAVCKMQNVQIREGDVVLFYTGWLKLMGKDNKRYMASEPGLGMDGAKYLINKKVACIGGDTWGVEAIPGEQPDAVFPINLYMIAENGVFVLEEINTEALIKDKAYEFMFVLGQPRYKGATQVIINPVGIK